MNIWIVMLCGGLATFAIRLSFIYLFGKLRVGEGLRRALYYVPPAVLSAIVFPELIMPGGTFDLSLGNVRLLAGAAAALIAWFSKSTLGTIAAGMAVLALLSFTGL